MADFIEGIDISVFQGSVPQATWDALYAQGQRVACIGSAHPRPNTWAEANLERAERAGMVPATYIVVYPSVPSANTVAVAKQSCGGVWSRLAFAAIDCETDGITEAQIFGMEEALRRENQKPIIYTGGWWWKGSFGDSQAFRHLPVWMANYSVPLGGDVPRYGGWTVDKLVGHQYTGTTSIPGVTYPHPGTGAIIPLAVDRNGFSKEFVMPQPVPTDAQRMNAARLILQAAETLLERRDLTEQQKAYLRYFGS